MPITTCVTAAEANALAADLVTLSVSYTEPDLTDDRYTFDPTIQFDSALQTTPSDLDIADITSGGVGGSGIFDVLMAAADAHISREYKANRITGDQYASIYTQLILGVMQTATQMGLSKDQSKFAAIQTQMQARQAQVQATAELVNLEVVKLQAVASRHNIEQVKANTGLLKMQLATANAEFCKAQAEAGKEEYVLDTVLPLEVATAQFNLDNILPSQQTLVDEQMEAQRAQTLDTRTNGVVISGVIGRANAVSEKDALTRDYVVTNTMPAQLAILEEQREAERAKTRDTLTDSSTVGGSIGKQVELYGQQISSFQADSRFKVARLVVDSWITQKTLDEGLTAPTNFTNASIDTILSSIRTQQGLT